MLDKRRAHWSEWVTTALAVLWLAFFPLWHGGSYSHITRDKWVAMLMLAGVTVAACLTMLIVLACRGELRRLKFTWVHMAALAYFGLVGLSGLLGSWADHMGAEGVKLFWGSDGLKAIWDTDGLTVIWGSGRYEGLITQGCYLLIFLCMSLTGVRASWLLDAAALSMLAQCAIIGIQYFDVNVFVLFPVGTSIRLHPEFQGTIGNTNMVVGYIGLVMPALLFGFALKKRGGWLWLLSGTAAVLLSLCINVDGALVLLAATMFFLVLMALRNPECRPRVMTILGLALMMLSVRMLLGLPWLDGTETLAFPHAPTLLKVLPVLAGVVLLALAVVLKHRPGPAMPVGWIAALAAVLVMAGFAVVYFAAFPENHFLWQLQEILHGRPQDAFGSERIGIWRITLEMNEGNRLWGTGPDTFLFAMDQYLRVTGQSLTQRFDAPHNLLLGVLSNNGLPALVMFIVLCGGAKVQGLRRAGKDASVMPLVLAAAGYMIQGMFTFSICLVTPMFWAALGLLTGQLQERNEESL